MIGSTTHLALIYDMFIPSSNSYLSPTSTCRVANIVYAVFGQIFCCSYFLLHSVFFWLCFLLFWVCCNSILDFWGLICCCFWAIYFCLYFFTTFCSLALFPAIFGFAAILCVDLLLFGDWFAATFVAIFCCFDVASRIIFCCVSVQLLAIFLSFFPAVSGFISFYFGVNFRHFWAWFPIGFEFFFAVSGLIPFCFGLILCYFGFIYLVIYLLFLGLISCNIWLFLC